MPDGDNSVRTFRGPGFGRRQTTPHPKGRQTDPDALTDVQGLLGDAPRDRDLLIEFLHLIQDAYGHLSARHLAALAEEMRLPMAEVFEVASFYAHFDLVMEGEDPPPPLTIRVCDSLTCEMMGAQELLKALPDAVGAFCARPAWAAATRRPWRRSATSTTRTPPWTRSPKPPPRAIPTR
jgi:NADH:ubiquinone oxidoreductase subunit E